jgi:hypothetical protein
MEKWASRAEALGDFLKIKRFQKPFLDRGKSTP